MKLQEVSEFLEEQKDALMSNSDDIESTYEQVIESLCLLRDQIFTFSFEENSTWKDKLNPEALNYHFEEYSLQSLKGEIQKNSAVLISVIDNLYITKNRYIRDLSSVGFAQLEEINKADQYAMDFIERIFKLETTAARRGQRGEYAAAVKQGLEEAFGGTIRPFWELFFEILLDQYRVQLRPYARDIIPSFEDYLESPDSYENMLQQKLRENEINIPKKVFDECISDLKHADEDLGTQISNKYEIDDEEIPENNPGHTYRLKEIASRYIYQANNLDRLAAILRSITTVFSSMTFTEKIINFIMRMVTGKGLKKANQLLEFTYLSRQGPITRKYASVQELRHNSITLLDQIETFKNRMRNDHYGKNLTGTQVSELNSFIDTCTYELTDIYDKGNGLREWMGSDQNARKLNSLPQKTQEEFSNILLHINQAIIINKEYFRELASR
ncbi:MAG: hypothetical protein ACLFR1_02300 [Spirochaetia bacterium]